jgi:hypothetical protein
MELMILSLIIGFTALMILLMFILFTSFSDIKRNIRLLFLRKKGFGIIYIIGSDGQIRSYEKKFSNEFEIGKNKYVMEEDKRLWNGNIPILIYEEGKSLPINIFSKEEDNIDSRAIYNMVMNARMELPKGWGDLFNDPAKLASIASAVLSGIAVVMIFLIQDKITIILQALK